MNQEIKPEQVAICGDWHGNTLWAASVLNRLGKMGVRKVIQVGDFGLWPGDGGIFYLDMLSDTCRDWGIHLSTLRGNHDWNYWEHLLSSEFTTFNPANGGAMIRSNITLLPRVADFRLGYTTFFVAGGAVSIDRAWRIEGESWWPEEELTDNEVDVIKREKYDVLLTHDCSNMTPWKTRMKPDPASVTHRRRIDRVLEKVTPDFHFHGHMHEWYDWMNGETQTYGLCMDGDTKNVAIFDTQAKRVVEII